MRKTYDEIKNLERAGEKNYRAFLVLPAAIKTEVKVEVDIDIAQPGA